MSYVKYTTRNYETLKKLSDIILDQRSLKKKRVYVNNYESLLTKSKKWPWKLKDWYS